MKQNHTKQHKQTKINLWKAW